MATINPSDKAMRSYSFLKGRLAEVLVERIFMNLGMEVYSVGFEAKLPRIAQLKSVGKIPPMAIERFEYGPDFIVCKSDKEGNDYKLYQVEVKYRKDGIISLSELEKYKDDNLFFVFLDKKNIFCIEKSEISAFKKQKLKFLEFKNCCSLAEHAAFSFTKREKRIITAFENLIIATLNNFIDDKKLKFQITGGKKEAEVFEQFYKSVKGI